MTKTPEQILANHLQHAERSKRGLEAAQSSGNTQLVVLNIQQGFKACLMQALIGWRVGIASPVMPMREAVQRVYDGLDALVVLKATDCAKDLPIEKACIVSFLINTPPPAVDITELGSDRLLDAVLANGLWGNWSNLSWQRGLEQLQGMEDTTLAVETYSAYHTLLNGPQAELSHLTDHATRLFTKRAKDRFFSGGDQTEGGGPNNTITADYRLAAVLKKIGYTGENPHLWHWV